MKPFKEYLEEALVNEERKSFMKLLSQLKKIEDEKELSVWYAALNKKHLEQGKLFDKLDDDERKMLMKNINSREEKIKKGMYK